MSSVSISSIKTSELIARFWWIVSGSSDIQWCFSQVKGTLDDDVTEGKTAFEGHSTILKLTDAKVVDMEPFFGHP